MSSLANWFPILTQATGYTRDKGISDMVAAIVVTVMLIPQSLAYAMLAGLPPHYGLYASIVPIIIYSVLGSSTTLAVGPVATASIMTASTLSSVISAGLINYVDGAITLAFLSGAILVSFGIFRFGFVANFLSHSVVSGFITASGLLIALSQLKHIIGVPITGHAFFDIAHSLITSLSMTNLPTLVIGIACIVFLVLSRHYAVSVLGIFGIKAKTAAIMARMSPIFAVCISAWVVAILSLDKSGVAIVGHIPTGIANPQLPSVTFEAIKALFLPALFIAIIGYVESISVGKTLGAKRNEKVDPNQELLALGGANLASSAADAFPVTGGFSRSVVNYDAGAQTQFAGIYTALGIALASLILTPYLYYLPIAMLAVTIIVAVLALVDIAVLKRAWQFSKSDFTAAFLTIVVTLLAGVEAGVASGIMTSVLLHLYHTSEPHIAEVGLIDGTEQFRNIKHYNVEVNPETVSFRIDESLLFSNASYLEAFIGSAVSERPQLQHVILHCGAVNTIDLTAMEMLENLNRTMISKGIQLHLSEVKTPVKTQLEKTHFLTELNGRLYRSHFEAYRETAHKENL